MMEKSGKEHDDSEQVLNFRDALIYRGDLKLVQSRTAWLNDSLIHFYFNVLSSIHGDNDCVFMDPSVVSFFIHQCCDDEDLEDFKASTTFPTTGLIFIPVNDNMKANANWMTPGAGYHWSLLVILVESGGAQFWHFDSVKSSGNYQAAKDIANKFSLLLEKPTTSPHLVDASTPQQKNGFDCGVHLLAAAKVFCAMDVTSNKQLQDFEMRMQEYAKQNPDFCSSLRQEIASEIIRIAALEN